MRETMHKLLGRKSNVRRLSNHDISNLRPGLQTDVAPERVFPIRNTRGEADPSWLGHNSPRESSKHSNGHTEPSLTASRSDESSRGEQNETRHEQRKFAEQSEFVFLKTGPLAVLPGAAATKDGVPYRRCEDEPIHTPGAIQSYGALLGLKYSAKGHLEVRVASENTRRIMGYGPEHLFTLTSFLDILRPDGRNEMTARINHTLDKVDALKDETRLDVFQIYLTFPYEPEIRLWCAIHLAPNPENMVICEFEEYLDAFYLSDMRMAKTLPESPIRTMDFEVTPEEFAKSTTVISKPLPVLEIARMRKNKEFSSLDIFNAMSQAQQQISACSSVQDVMGVTVGIIEELTGFHRVMCYRFDAAHNGCVDAELLNPRASTDVFRGLHFPASDIPKQARELYIINRIRILHDRCAETSRLVCRDVNDMDYPLDLTHSYLRAMSPVHNKYLANMGVRSTMSISIVVDSRLWGLLACHGYGDGGIRVSLPIRELCRNIGECAAINIKQLLMKKRLEVRKPPPVNSLSHNPASHIAASADELLRLVDADFAMLSIEEESRAIGKLDPYQEALAIMTYLQTCHFTEIRSSVNINADFPGIAYPPGINKISGLLIVPFNIHGLNDFMVFFRRGQLREVKWAGNPYEKTFKPGSDYLDPRASFQRWTETIVGTCREWTIDQLDTASVLSLLYGRFVEIWRQRGSGPSNDKMSMIRTSSRELRNPMNTITGYLEMALENKVDNKTRHFLSRAQEASNLMAAAVDNLSRLIDPEDGSAPPAEETFNLSLTVSKIIKALQKEAQRKSLDLTIVVHENLPSMVKGDADRLKHLLVHLISNSFLKTTAVQVDINLISAKDDQSVIGLRVQDRGPGMTEAELDNVFQEMEQAHDENDWLFASENAKSTSNGKKIDASSDLVMIARYVHAVNGQIRVTSEVGRGTLFTIELPFEHVHIGSSSNMPRRLRNLFSPTGGSGKGPAPTSTKAANPVPSSLASPPKAIKFIPNESHRKVDSFPVPLVESQIPSRLDLQARDKERNLDERRAGHPEGSVRSVARSASRLSMQPRDKTPSPSPELGGGFDSLREDIEPFRNTTNSQPQLSERNHSPKPTTYENANMANMYNPRVDSMPSHPSGLKVESPEPQDCLNLLIAEDNFVTQKLLDKQLSQLGHSVVIVSDGQDCHDHFIANPSKIDVVLMDLKMPLVDGPLSTQMIRYSEKETKRLAREKDRAQSPKPRVPIIAVSADLGEDGRFECIQSGFDGWLMKPVDFQTLNTLLTGVKDRSSKRDCLFVPGGKGGWFFP